MSISAWLYVLVAYLAGDVIATVYMIGRPRKPASPALAILTIFTHAGWIVLLVLAAMRLS